MKSGVIIVLPVLFVDIWSVFEVIYFLFVIIHVIDFKLKNIMQQFCRSYFCTIISFWFYVFDIVKTNLIKWYIMWKKVVLCYSLHTPAPLIESGGNINFELSVHLNFISTLFLGSVWPNFYVTLWERRYVYPWLVSNGSRYTELRSLISYTI